MNFELKFDHSDDTPMTNVALEAVVLARGELGLEHRALVDTCRQLERRLTTCQRRYAALQAAALRMLEEGAGQRERERGSR